MLHSSGYERIFLIVVQADIALDFQRLINISDQEFLTSGRLFHGRKSSQHEELDRVRI